MFRAGRCRQRRSVPDMTTTRGRLLPLRSRVVVSLLALCGATAGFVVADAVGAGHSVGWHDDDRAQAAVCLLNPQGCDSGSVGSGKVTIRRDKRTGGKPGTPGSRQPIGSIIVVPAPVLDPRNLNFVCSLIDPPPWYCPVQTIRVVPAVPGRGPLTLSDIASFIPRAPTLVSEPDGWGIRALPVNFVGGSTIHLRSGTLLSEPATVRFVPVRYLWEFGDGTSRSTTRPGRSWRSLGLPDFSSTATSHVYLSPGSYRARLTVTYRAEYSIANSSWRSIQGTLTRDARTSVAVSEGGEPLLVARDCVNAPATAGC